MQISGKKQQKKRHAAVGLGGATSDTTTTAKPSSISVPSSLLGTSTSSAGLLQYVQDERVTWLLPGMCVLRQAIPVATQQRIVDEAFRFGQQSHLTTLSAGDGRQQSSTEKRDTSSSTYNTEKATTTIKSKTQVLDSGFYTETRIGGGALRLNQGNRGRLIVPVDHLDSQFWSQSCAQWIKTAQESNPHGRQTLPEDMVPTIALMNYYNKEGTFKWHVDSEHPDHVKNHTGPPIVSVTIGDSCEFGYKRSYSTSTGGGTVNPGGGRLVGGEEGLSEDPSSYSSVVLNSGDVLLFGGPARMIVHSVLKVIPSPRPAGLKMPPNGRLNVTLRDVRNGKVDEDMFPMYRVSYS